MKSKVVFLIVAVAMVSASGQQAGTPQVGEARAKTSEQGPARNKSWHYTYGTFDSAAAMSVSAGAPEEPATQVEGLTSHSQLSTYASRDSVALFAQNTAQPPLMMTSKTTFTPTSVTSPDFAAIASTVKVGMIIDVEGSPKISGIVTGIRGNTLMVSNWYRVDGSLGTETPRNGERTVVNPATAAWALNTLCTIPRNGYATKCVGAEFDLDLKKPGTGANSLGVEVVNVAPSIEPPYAAFAATGNFTRGYVVNASGRSAVTYGFESQRAATTNFLATQKGNANTNYISQDANTGFNSQGDRIGLLIDSPTAAAIAVRAGSQSKFSVSPAGEVVGASLSLGGGVPVSGTSGSGRNIMTDSSPAMANPKINAGVAQGSGHKHQRVASCRTSAQEGATCDTTLRWSEAFADANYTVVCSSTNWKNEAVGQGVVRYSAEEVVFRIAAGSGAAASSTIDCIAEHD